jgi:arylsulfatase
MIPARVRRLLRWLCLVGWMLRVASPCHAAEGALAGSRPNIVVIITDDQGWGELSCHGNPVLRTPNLDRLHAESLRLTRFHVSPTCAPTRAALMTGRHEFRSGVTHTVNERERLDPRATLLPELMRRAGYSTGIFGKWHLGDEDEYQPGRRGFEKTVIHGAGGIGQTFPGSCGDVPGNTYHDPWVRHDGRFERRKGYCTDVFVDAAWEWIEEASRRRRPFLAWIAPNAPHDPFVSPGDEWDKPYRDRGLPPVAVPYYAMIAHLDAAVGRLLARLDSAGLGRDTLVVFMTDNGHSVPGIFNGGMRAMKGTVYEGGIRVPSFWRWPGRLPSGVDATPWTAHVDVLPTFLGLAGARVPDGVEGRSLLPLLENPAAPWPSRLLFSHLGRWKTGGAREAAHQQGAVSDGRFKLVNDSELYDVVADPGESTNRIQDLPAVTARLRAAYRGWWDGILRDAQLNEWAMGPLLNPYAAAFSEALGVLPSTEEQLRMDPTRKFMVDRAW